MRPFDLKEALNGAPVALYSGRKAYILADLRTLFPDTETNHPLFGVHSSCDNANKFACYEEWNLDGECKNGTDYVNPYNIVGMWEEPELTSKESLEKAFLEKKQVIDDDSCIFVVIGKTRDGKYIATFGEGLNYAILNDKKTYQIYQPEQKSKTITVTLPRPVKPKAGKCFWFIDANNKSLCVTKAMRAMLADKFTPDGNYFASEADAQAWLDALKEAMGDE